MKQSWKVLLCLALTVVALVLPGCDNTEPPVESSGDPVVETPVQQDLSIVSGGASAYSIIIRESASETVSEAAREIISAIEAKTGVKLAWTDDYLADGDPIPPKEILIGITDREESAAVLGELKYGEYAIHPMGDKLVIAAWDDASLAKACGVFVNQIKRFAAEGQFVLPGDYAAQAEGLKVLTEMPHYGSAGEKIRFVDLADDCYMLYADDTDEAEFKAYLSVLENAGYTSFATRQMADNLYATYVSDTKVIHASYTASKKDARIAIEDAYDMTLFMETEYEKICEPSVTLVGLESYGGDEGLGVGNQLGLCLIFRMADGRFVIVDGGNHNNATIPLLNNNLRELAVDKDNIVIAAWIMTHAHGDHVGAFVKFSNSAYKNKVTVQNFVHHLCTAEQYENCNDAGRADQTRQLMKTYKGANIIKAHTGQVMKIAGAEIEMLFTSADLEPYVLDYHNTSSLVFRVTAEGNSVMVLGDASTVSNGHMVKIYGDYLKSDMVQIAHHGFQGGTVPLYEAIQAKVALWPTGVASIDGSYKSLMDKNYNAKAVELADEVYIAGMVGHTLIMPYTPVANDTAKFYT